jgi:hypothetical protein
MKATKELIYDIVVHKILPTSWGEWYPIDVQTSLKNRFSIEISCEEVKGYLEELVQENRLGAVHDRPGTTYRSKNRW